MKSLWLVIFQEENLVQEKMKKFLYLYSIFILHILNLVFILECFHQKE